MKYYVARDKNKKLFLYRKSKPYLDNNVMYGSWNTFDDFMQIDRTLFPELKWTDEPILVELKVVKI